MAGSVTWNRASPAATAVAKFVVEARPPESAKDSALTESIFAVSLGEAASPGTFKIERNSAGEAESLILSLSLLSNARRRAPWCSLPASCGPGCRALVLRYPIRLQDVPITPLIHCPGPEDLQFIQGNITEQPLNASQLEGFIHRSQLLLHIRHDVGCNFESDPLTNHAGPKNRAVDECSQVVLIPLHN